jgi:hypothetical protein
LLSKAAAARSKGFHWPLQLRGTQPYANTDKSNLKVETEGTTNITRTVKPLFDNCGPIRNQIKAPGMYATHCSLGQSELKQHPKRKHEINAMLQAATQR